VPLIIGLHEQRLCLIEISLPQGEFGGKDQILLAVVGVGLEDRASNLMVINVGQERPIGGAAARNRLRRCSANRWWLGGVLAD
jgi:hypothetical protein